MKLIKNDHSKPTEAQKDTQSEFEALNQIQTQHKMHLDQLVQNMLQKQNVQNFFSQLNNAQLQGHDQQTVVDLPLELFNFSLSNYTNNNEKKEVTSLEINDNDNFLARLKIDFNFSTKKYLIIKSLNLFSILLICNILIRTDQNNSTPVPEKYSSTYLIRKNKFTIGRRIKINEQSNSPSPNINTTQIITECQDLSPDQNSEPTDIFIENSTLVSRQHLSFQLKTNSSKANDRLNFWQMQSISKNGIFLNNHYIEKGKSIKLFLNKRYTMRFPNTNIKIYFESNDVPVVDQNNPDECEKKSQTEPDTSAQFSHLQSKGTHLITN